MPEASLADVRMRELLELISSNSISPGAGAAGAVTLALGAACAAKAVAISLKHSPHDAQLASALSGLGQIRGFALQGADADSRAFAEFVRHRSLAGASELIETGEAMAHLIRALVAIIEHVESHVSPSMSGDLIAAKSLAAAARTIQSTNQAGTKDEQRAMNDSAGKFPR